MKSIISLIISLSIIIVLLSSCSKDVIIATDTISYTKVAEAVTDGSTFNVVMYAIESPFIGYNKVYFKVLNNVNGQAVNQASLTIHPLMNMGTSTHACPIENPQSNVNANGYYEGAVLFSMAGTNSWSVGVNVVTGGKNETANLTIPDVITTTPVRKIVVVDNLDNGTGGVIVTKYPLSLVVPKAWKVGNNTFEIIANRQADMMNFPPATDLTFEITPEMPSMGHGSPNNVNPVHIANGHYVGSVNFTMTGDWRIHLTIKQGSRLITDQMYFDVLF